METSNKYVLLHDIRSLGLAYVLLFLFGTHYAYLNKWLFQVLYWASLAVTTLSWVLYMYVEGTQLVEATEACRMCRFLWLSSMGLTLLVVGWWFKCAFELPEMVRKYNKPIESTLHKMDQENSTT